jgi:hypothetical protein
LVYSINLNKNKIYKSISKQIIENLDSLEILEKILGNSFGHIYTVNNKPILQYISIKIFYAKFKLLHNKEKRKLAAILKHRFRHKEFRDQLRDEKDWLKSLQSVFKKNKKSGCISGLIYRDLVVYIGEILNEFEKDKLNASSAE